MMGSSPRRSMRLTSSRSAPPQPSTDVPSIYHEMLAEAAAQEKSRPQKKPGKRRRVDSSPNPTPDEEGLSSTGALNTGPAQHPPTRIKLTVPGSPNSKQTNNLEPKQKRPLRNSQGSARQYGPSFPPWPLVKGILEDLSDGDDDENLDFEDVKIPELVVQTIVRDSDDEDSESDSDRDEDENEEVDFQNIDFDNLTNALTETANNGLELNLTAQQSTLAQSIAKSTRSKRKPLSKEEKKMRFDVHRLHLLCLVWHASIRNHWCNNRKVQHAMKKHLTRQVRDFLCPKKTMLPFAQSLSLKRGLTMSVSLWSIQYHITERGMKRALWASLPEELQEYEPPDNLETCPTFSDFLICANGFAGSRDVGAQLYCTYLRAAGVRARLVCSLQVLGFGPGSPPMVPPKLKLNKIQEQRLENEGKKRRAMELYKEPEPDGPSTALAYRKRAMDIRPRASVKPPLIPKVSKEIIENPHPVYWVEVWDQADGVWIPVDPLVTKSVGRPKSLEPPLNDRDNIMSYVIAFNEDGSFRDVTCRYTKMFKAKTQKLRIEYGLPGDGEAWWKRIVKLYTKPRLRPSKAQIKEDEDLRQMLAAEPMPKNISDFRGHPECVLERHLRRYEVLKPGARPRGTIKVSNRTAPEKVFCREDVCIVHSKQKWFRLGREVRPFEQPAKYLQTRVRKSNDRHAEPELEITPVYTEEQTDIFQHPSVIDGRVPRNQFGNLEIYTPSMIPFGGTYIAHAKAVKAAFLLGIDYAPAVAGFEFRGRNGTAVMKGAVVAQEHEEAMLAVCEGFDNMVIEALEEKKKRQVLKAWRRFMLALRIHADVWKDVDVAKEEREMEERRLDRLNAERLRWQKGKRVAEPDVEMDTPMPTSTITDETLICQPEAEECYEFEFDEDDESSSEDEGGGFLAEDGDDMAGGFIVD